MIAEGNSSLGEPQARPTVIAEGKSSGEPKEVRQ